MERSDFAKFFAAVNQGRTPFRWQERLLDTILEACRWPDRVAAPTGAGKTSVIDVHVFAVALTPQGPRLPRRLVMVVNRRVLVDDQYQRARALAAALERPEDDLTAEVAALLAGLRWPGRKVGQRGAGSGSPLVTGRLRGGAVPSRSWRDYPSACAVLCATPDMWGSRLLFRGYGTPALAAAREAGLLAFDSTVMVDEAHLARQLLVTARQVARLAAVAENPLAGVPVLQVTEVTATPDPAAAGTSVTVGDEDLGEDLLAARLTRPKPVTLIPVAGLVCGRQARQDRGHGSGCGGRDGRPDPRPGRHGADRRLLREHGADGGHGGGAAPVLGRRRPAAEGRARARRGPALGPGPAPRGVPRPVDPGRIRPGRCDRRYPEPGSGGGPGSGRDRDRACRRISARAACRAGEPARAAPAGTHHNHRVHRTSDR